MKPTHGLRTMPTYEIRVVTGIKTVAVKVPDDIAARVSELVAARICLGCRKQQPKEKRYIRGLCKNCETAKRVAIEEGTATEAELMRSGELAPPSPPGRKPASEFSARMRGRR